ncbi:phage antirepressor KilAC domain-containing protein [Gordonia tangerina]|uniref:Phage antirepressor KilAC domain-containing protein n=1 Tax=Gordonia tangerina TaxID=2911060 RepID=A0ABS9DL46_9ACTN|nr:phage antirepressor KilAC domain-containing protein [Gordonia tangerina]MCF3939957.1 phage antirepressor KilAC domain-containing protein [Gordonia tangerina]
MTQNITPIDGEGSPFDAIRRTTPEGREYWSARDLMPLLGYDRWENFARAIARAEIAVDAQGSDHDHHFRDATKVVQRSQGGGSKLADVELTRFAAYQVAMCGDPRKVEVAAALAYFAIRTREAEVAQPAIPDISTADGVLAMADMFRDTARKLVVVENEKKALAARIEKDAPLVAKAEAHTGSDSAVHRQEFAREVITWGLRQKNLTIKQEQVMRFLGHIGLFIRGERTDTGHATADAMKRGLAFTDKGTAKNGYAWATGKLTARGQDYAWKRITKHVDEYGSLELPRELRGGDPA